MLYADCRRYAAAATPPCCFAAFAADATAAAILHAVFATFRI